MRAHAQSLLELPVSTLDAGDGAEIPWGICSLSGCDAGSKTENSHVQVQKGAEKKRLSSHGSSGCPRRTIRLYMSVLPKSSFQPRKLSVSAAYYVCTTKSRLSSHGSSACPRRTTLVLQKSIFQPRKPRAYDVCTTQVDKKTQKTLRFSYERPQRGDVCMSRNAKTRRFWHRANAETRRGVTFVCHKTQKHDGFGTAPTPKPAEGCLRPQKSTKNDGFSTATRRSPAEGCPRKSRKRWF